MNEQVLTKNQALFVAQQIEAVITSQLLGISDGLDRLTWRFRVPHPSRQMTTWIHIEWEGYIEDKNYRQISVSNPDDGKAPEIHKSLMDFRRFYRLNHNGRAIN